jgi:hypothetical protein
VRFSLLEYELNGSLTVKFFVYFQFPAMFNTIVGAGAGAASRYGSSSVSDQKMHLLAAPAPQHWLEQSRNMAYFKAMFFLK